MNAEAKTPSNSNETAHIIDASQALLEAVSEFTVADPLHQATMLALRKHIHRLLQRADLSLKELSQLAGIYAKLLRAEMAFRKATTPPAAKREPAPRPTIAGKPSPLRTSPMPPPPPLTAAPVPARAGGLSQPPPPVTIGNFA